MEADSGRHWKLAVGDQLEGIVRGDSQLKESHSSGGQWERALKLTGQLIFPHIGPNKRVTFSVNGNEELITPNQLSLSCAFYLLHLNQLLHNTCFHHMAIHSL